MRPSIGCIDLGPCLSDITSTDFGACADTVVAIFGEPPAGSFVLTAYALEVVIQMARVDVPC